MLFLHPSRAKIRNLRNEYSWLMPSSSKSERGRKEVVHAHKQLNDISTRETSTKERLALGVVENLLHNSRSRNFLILTAVNIDKQ